MSVQNGNSLSSIDHRRHDRLLVTRFAVDDAYPSEREEAQRLVERCSECAALAADIRLIARSTRALPIPARSRDFTITAEQAERLRGHRVTRWLRALAAPGLGVLRPVAAAALSIGLVVAAVGAAMPTPAGAPASEFQSSSDRVRASMPPERAPAATSDGPPEVHAPAAQPDPTGAPADAPGLEEPQTVTPNRGEDGSATHDPATRGLNEAYTGESPRPEDDGSLSAAPPEATPTDTTRDLFVYAGLAVAALSLGLLTLAWLARRYLADPLLR